MKKKTAAVYVNGNATAYAMFSPAGDAAVAGIVAAVKASGGTPEQQWEAAQAGLTVLAATTAHAEATDTVVREEVYAELFAARINGEAAAPPETVVSAGAIPKTVLWAGSVRAPAVTYDMSGQWHCSTHGDVDVVSRDQFIGFAGGICYVTVLSCGCQDVDESADIEAAR